MISAISSVPVLFSIARCRRPVTVKGKCGQHGRLSALDVKRDEIGVGDAGVIQNPAEGAGFHPQHALLVAGIGADLVQQAGFIGEERPDIWV